MNDSTSDVKDIKNANELSLSFNSLFKNNNIASVSQTIKVPTDIDLFANDIAVELYKSKHEVLVSMLRDGANFARNTYENNNSLINEPLSEGNDGTNYFMLNTNKGQDEETHNWMVKDRVAAAFGERCKRKIEHIKEGDVIFHYESGSGIIGYGFATGSFKSKNYYGVPDNAYYYELDDYKQLNMPVSAKEIQEILKRKIPFASTMINLWDGDVLKKELSQKG